MVSRSEVDCYPDGSPIKDLVYFTSFVNENSLSGREVVVLREIMWRAYPHTRRKWRSSNCHDCSYSVLSYFRDHPAVFPPDAGMLLVSAASNHSWIELFVRQDSKETEKYRGNIIFDAVGLWSNDDTPFFGHTDYAPPSLAVRYTDPNGHRIETLTGEIFKTPDSYIYPWDEEGFFERIQRSVHK